MPFFMVFPFLCKCLLVYSCSYFHVCVQLVDRCAALLAESDDLMARLKAERPVATDISVLQDQFTSLAVSFVLPLTGWASACS